MPIENNITISDSDGAKKCFVCEQMISKGEKALRISFMVDLVIKKIQVHEEAHPRCAVKAAELIWKKVQEIRKS